MFYLRGDFEKILLVNDKVPVVGKHMSELLWNFNLVPGYLKVSILSSQKF